MANTASITAAPREAGGKGAARRLRREGRIPAVLYGHGEETRALSVDAHELEVLFSHISVENTVIEVAIEGGKAKKAAPVRALVREVQTHPYRQQILHVDFYQLHAGVKVDVEVPIRLVGAAAGVKAGGVLQQQLHEIAVSCLPESIPDHIDVDVSALDVNESIHVRDLTLGEGIDVETEGDRTVCAVLPPTVQPVEEPEALELEGVGGEVEPELVRRRGAEAEEEEEEEGGE